MHLMDILHIFFKFLLNYCASSTLENAEVHKLPLCNQTPANTLNTNVALSYIQKLYINMKIEINPKHNVNLIVHVLCRRKYFKFALQSKDGQVGPLHVFCPFRYEALTLCNYINPRF